MSQTVLSAREGRVAILTINRPDKLNALNEEVRVELLAALAEIETDDGVGAVVITGSGEKSFIAGADIGEFAGRSPFDQRFAMRSPRIFDVMASFPKPVIAMINGFCLGGGCELSMSCDMRIAYYFSATDLLLANELIIRHIVIEGLDDIISVIPCVGALLVHLKAVAFRKAHYI